jgi:hypothetical protein
MISLESSYEEIDSLIQGKLLKDYQNKILTHDQYLHMSRKLYATLSYLSTNFLVESGRLNVKNRIFIKNHET